MRVITNTAISLDGRIASAHRERIAIGSSFDRQYMSVLRARADAVLVGGNTFRTWPIPLAPDPAALAAVRACGFPDADHPPIEGRRWWNVVLSRGSALPTQGRVYQDPRVRPLFFLPTPWAGPAPAEVDVGPTDIRSVLARLAARGVGTLLVEAGGELIAQLLAAQAIDELHVTVCPLLLGGTGAPSLVGGEGFRVADAPRLRLCHAHRVGEELFCKYEVRRGG